MINNKHIAIAGLISVAVLVANGQFQEQSQPGGPLVPQATVASVVEPMVVPVDSAVLRQTGLAETTASTAEPTPLTDVQLSRMSPSVQALAARGGNEAVDLIVAYQSAPEQQEVNRAVALGASIQRSYPSLGMVSLRLPAAALGQLSLSENIKHLSLNAKVEASAALTIAPLQPIGVAEIETIGNSGLETANVPYLNGDKLLAMGAAGIAVIDSGVNDHWDLNVASRYDCTAAATSLSKQALSGCVDVVSLGMQGRSLDPFGHGTHVASVASGDGSDSGGKYKGVATRLPIHSFQVLNGRARARFRRHRRLRLDP